MIAVEKEFTEVVKLLLQKSADTNIQNNDNVTAYDIARELNN